MKDDEKTATKLASELKVGDKIPSPNTGSTLIITEVETLGGKTRGYAKPPNVSGRSISFEFKSTDQVELR